MKNWFVLFATLFATTFIGFSQLNSIPDDSLINRMNLNSLNLTIESGTPSAEDYFNRGNLHAFFGDSTKAILDYTTAISRNEDLDLAYLSRGSLYQKMNKYELAEADFNTAIKLDKLPSVALNNRGYLYQTWGKIDKAIKDYERAIKIDPVETKPYMNLVDVYINRGEIETAFSTLDRMIEVRPKDPKAYASRSDVYSNMGRLREALDDLNTAVEISGNDPGYLVERAKFKDDQLFDDLGAVEDCDLAIEKNPSVAEYYYQRSRPLYDLEDYTGVLENCEKAIELDPKHVNALIMKANVTDMYKMHAEAKLLYDRAIAIAPNDYDGYKQLSVSEFAQGNKQEALSILEIFMNRGNFHRDITEQHGKIAADLKQYDISLNDFSELIDRYPNDPTFYFLRGITQDSIGNYEAACDDMLLSDKLGLREAHQYLRENCKSKLNAKQMKIEDMLDATFQLERNGQTKEAITAYTDLIKIAPDSSAFYYNRGKAKRRLEDHEGAIEDYLTAIEMDDDRVVYLVSLAVSYSYLDKIDDAIKEYKKAIKIDPTYAMSYYNLGGIYAEQDKFQKAIELFETSIYYSPKYTKAMMGLGECYIEMGDMDKACEWYTRAENAGESRAFGKRVRTCE